MLHESKSAEPKDGDARAGVSPPLSVQVHLNVFVEHTITALDSFTFNALAEVSNLFGVVLDCVARLTRIGLVERKEALS